MSTTKNSKQENYIEIDKKKNILTLNIFDVERNFGPVTITPIDEFNLYSPVGDNSKHIACFDGHLKIKIGLEYIENINDLGYIGKFENIQEVEQYFYRFRDEKEEKQKVDFSKIIDETYVIKDLWLTSDDTFINFNKSRSVINIGCSSFKSSILKSRIQAIIDTYNDVKSNKKYGSYISITMGDVDDSDDEFEFIISKKGSDVSVFIRPESWDSDCREPINIELLKDFVKLIDNKLGKSKYFEKLVPGKLYESYDGIEFMYKNYNNIKDDDDTIEVVFSTTNEIYTYCVFDYIGFNEPKSKKDSKGKDKK